MSFLETRPQLFDLKTDREIGRCNFSYVFPNRAFHGDQKGVTLNRIGAHPRGLAASGLQSMTTSANRR